MATLYEISEELAALDDALTESGGEFDADGELEKWFATVHTARDEKLDGYCKLIRNLTARALARETESRRLTDRAAVDRAAIARLKDRLLLFFGAHGYTKLNAGIWTLSVARNGGKLPLLVPDPEVVPEEFTNLVPVIDRARIREYLERGNELPFARLGERGFNLRIT